MKKILVTGGAGYIGSACVKDLVENYEVFVLDNLSKGIKDLVSLKATFVEGDILNKNDLETLFSQHQFDSVIHCAALKAVGESEEFPERYYETNVSGTINLLSVMSKYNTRKILFSSTACVYEEKPEGIYSETDPLKPTNTYGWTKVMCENLIQEYSRLKGLEYTIFRYFNVAGDYGLDYLDPQAQNVFPILAEALSGKRDKFEVFGDDYQTKDGSCVRDYIHISDLVSAHLLAIESKHSGIYNLGTQEGTSVKELIGQFEKVSHHEMNWVIAPRRQGDIGVSLANSSKAFKELGWTPKGTLDSMVESTLQVYAKK